MRLATAAPFALALATAGGVHADECGNATAAPRCGALQVCIDQDASVDGDWECRCLAPARGAPVVGRNATCMLDECSEVCLTCAPAGVCGAGQTCTDPDPTALRDWTCVCNPPGAGVRVGGPAVCGAAASPLPPRRASVGAPCLGVWDAPACAEGTADCSTCGGRIDDLLAAGMSEHTARRAVARDFPGTCGACWGAPGNAVFLARAAAVAAAFVSNPGPPLRLVAAARHCPAGDRALLAPPLHATGMDVAGGAAAGAVLGNIALCTAFLLLASIALCAVRGLPGTVPAWVAFTADVVAFALPLLMFPGTAVGAWRAVFDAASATAVVVGVAGLAACTAFLAVTHASVAEAVPGKALYATPPEPRGRWAAHLLGPGEWVSLRPVRHPWVYRWWVMIRLFRGPLAWFMAVDMFASLAVAAVVALHADTAVGCGHIAVALAAISTIFAAAVAVLCPYNTPRNNVLDVVGTLAVAVALICKSVGHYSDDPSRLEGAADAAYVAGLLAVVLRVLLDVVAALVAWATSSRRHVQRAIYDRKALPVREAARSTVRILPELCSDTAQTPTGVTPPAMGLGFGASSASLMTTSQPVLPDAVQLIPLDESAATHESMLSATRHVSADSECVTARSAEGNTTSATAAPLSTQTSTLTPGGPGGALHSGLAFEGSPQAQRARRLSGSVGIGAARDSPRGRQARSSVASLQASHSSLALLQAVGSPLAVARRETSIGSTGPARRVSRSARERWSGGVSTPLHAPSPLASTALTPLLASSPSLLSMLPVARRQTGSSQDTGDRSPLLRRACSLDEDDWLEHRTPTTAVGRRSFGASISQTALRAGGNLALVTACAEPRGGTPPPHPAAVLRAPPHRTPPRPSPPQALL